MTLTAIFEEVSPSDGGGYVAYTEELPGAISEGDTLEEARENLRDAISLLLAANRELIGKPRPGPECHPREDYDFGRVGFTGLPILKRADLIRHLESFWLHATSRRSQAQRLLQPCRCSAQAPFLAIAKSRTQRRFGSVSNLVFPILSAEQRSQGAKCRLSTAKE
jgi:predicted RNase H-like HicB family nuclease